MQLVLPLSQPFSGVLSVAAEASLVGSALACSVFVSPFEVSVPQDQKRVEDKNNIDKLRSKIFLIASMETLPFDKV